MTANQNKIIKSNISSSLFKSFKPLSYRQATVNDVLPSTISLQHLSSEGGHRAAPTGSWTVSPSSEQSPHYVRTKGDGKLQPAPILVPEFGT